MASKICTDIDPWTTVRFSEQIMSTDKYQCIFSCQMEAIVYNLLSSIDVFGGFLLLGYSLQSVHVVGGRNSLTRAKVLVRGSLNGLLGEI